MAVATKAAAFCVFARFFEVALGPSVDDWDAALAALAAISIVVGNVGALGQDSLKRLLGYSGIAQAGYMLVGDRRRLRGRGQRARLLPRRLHADEPGGVRRDRVRERETDLGDDIRSVEGLGARAPRLAWPLTISMLALAGLPGTAGFIGKLFLIEAAVDGDFTWLGVVIAIGTMISLAYYLRVIAAVWMRPGAGRARRCRRSRAGRRRRTPRRTADCADAPSRVPDDPRPDGDLRAAATVFFGIIPSPLVDLAANAGSAERSRRLGGCGRRRGRPRRRSRPRGSRRPSAAMSSVGRLPVANRDADRRVARATSSGQPAGAVLLDALDRVGGARSGSLGVDRDQDLVDHDLVDELERGVGVELRGHEARALRAALDELGDAASAERAQRRVQTKPRAGASTRERIGTSRERLRPAVR